MVRKKSGETVKGSSICARVSSSAGRPRKQSILQPGGTSYGSSPAKERHFVLIMRSLSREVFTLECVWCAEGM